MNKISLILNFFLFYLIVCTSTPAFSANDEHKKLSHIIAEIDTVKKKLEHHKIVQSHVKKSIQKTTIAINELKSKLQKTAKIMQSTKQNLQELNQKHLNINNQINQQREWLAEQIRAGYFLSTHQDNLKNLCHGEDPNKIHRMLMYDKFLNEQRIEKLKSLNQNLSLLTKNKKTIESETQKLDDLQSHQKQEQLLLLTQQQNKAQILKSINEQLADNTHRLSNLINNKKQLEMKIHELAQVKVSENYLTHHKGKFPWPLHGKVVESFGSTIAQSQLKQSGVLIGGTAKQAVTAVAPGKVIFANSMSGYGLLLIVAHGNGYMTLYGNNTILYKKVNDTVKTGELIGRLGDASKNVLYFGLRKNGKPINPCQWCGSS